MKFSGIVLHENGYKRKHFQSACVCNHTHNDQNETPRNMIEPSVLAGTYGTRVPVRSVGLLHRGRFYGDWDLNLHLPE
uniref:Uncharacterized protein n=1 Tax=Trichogramma kaykai TaxID=54128 RepID=A0ABD2W9Y5_9HYME